MNAAFLCYGLPATTLGCLSLWMGLPRLYAYYGQSYFECTADEASLPKKQRAIVLAFYLLAAAVWLTTHPLDIVLSSNLLLTAIGLAVTTMDLRYRVIPDRLHGLALLVLSLETGSRLLAGQRLAWGGIVANLGLVACLFAAGLLYERWRKKEGMGLGDIKLLVWMGIALPELFGLILFGSLLAAVSAQAIKAIWTHKNTLQDSFALGPFLVAFFLLGRFLS